MNREEKRRALEKAAVGLMEEHGILAGFTSKTLAERAGVNRGHVHHYFGSFRALMLSALASEVDEAADALSAGQDQTFRDRYRWYFDFGLTQEAAFKLAAVLTVDGGGAEFQMMSLFSQSMENLQTDVDNRVLPPNTDLEALHVALISLARGYVVHRTKFAEEARINVADLDARVGKVLELILGSVATRGEGRDKDD